MSKKKGDSTRDILVEIRDRLAKVESRLSMLDSQESKLQVLEERISNIGHSVETAPRKADEVFLEASKTSVNPWLEASLRRLNTFEAERYITQMRETLESTIKALSSSRRGMDAEAVAKVTGKERNTESYYLNKLCRMGLVSKEREGRKVIYKISAGKKESLRTLFGVEVP